MENNMANALEDLCGPARIQSFVVPGPAPRTQPVPEGHNCAKGKGV